MICPRCGGVTCVIPANVVLERAPFMYAACRSCAPDPVVSKQAPFDQLDPVLRDLDDGAMRCAECGKRHLDVTIAHVLGILVREGLRGQQATLFDVGTPMIAVGYPIPFPPRLGRDTLILVMDSIDRKTAEMITAEVSEVKGVIQRKGRPDKPIGILDTGNPPHTYNLLAGCDVRADIISSVFGELCIYKTQSDTHIEFARSESGKIAVLESLYYQRKLAGVVVDACCGAGTLGLLSVLAGAREVILNDAFLPAVKNTLMNIGANADLLGLDSGLNIYVDPLELPQIACAPTLVATARGSRGASVSVYHSDLADLAAVVDCFDHCNLCLIDAFIGVPTDRFVRAWEKNAEMVVTM